MRFAQVGTTHAHIGTSRSRATSTGTPAIEGHPHPAHARRSGRPRPATRLLELGHAAPAAVRLPARGALVAGAGLAARVRVDVADGAVRVAAGTGGRGAGSRSPPAGA